MREHFSNFAQSALKVRTPISPLTNPHNNNYLKVRSPYLGNLTDPIRKEDTERTFGRGVLGFESARDTLQVLSLKNISRVTFFR